MSEPTRCRGILGLIFGHRFDPGWDPVFCSRCGFVPDRYGPDTQEADQ